MKFASDEDYKQFIELACMLKFYKAKGVPVPADIKDYIVRNRNKNEVCYVLHDLLNE